MKQTSNLFYKKYDTIRLTLRRIYLYGCYSRNDYSQNISARKYDNELARINMLFGGERVVSNYKNKNKYTTINYQYFDDNENFLATSYLAKAFTANEFKIYFSAMQLLNSSDNLSLAKIEHQLSDYICDIDRATLRNHLDKMVSEGYLTATISGKTKIYSLGNDVLADFTKDELINLLTTVQFAKNITPLKMYGNYAFTTIKNYLKDKFDCDYFGINLIFRHNYPHLILDEDILLDLQNAVEEKLIVSFTYSSKKRENLYPLEIKFDKYYGRQYLLAYDKSCKKYFIYRLDKISSVEISKKHFIFESKQFENSFGVSVDDTSQQKVKIDFAFDPQTEIHSIKRLYRERRRGEISKNENAYTLSIEITDIREMLPWLRSFYGNILSTDNKELNKLIRTDIERMVAAYEHI